MKQKHIAEAKDALRNGANEIERLRRENELLSIRAHAFDTFAELILLLAPKREQGYGIDAVWILRKLLAEIEAEEQSVAEKDRLNGEHDKALNLGNAVSA